MDYGYKVENNWLHRKEWFMYLWVARGKYLKSTGPSTEVCALKCLLKLCMLQDFKGRPNNTEWAQPNPLGSNVGLLQAIFHISYIWDPSTLFQDHYCHSNASPHHLWARLWQRLLSWGSFSPSPLYQTVVYSAITESLPQWFKQVSDLLLFTCNKKSGYRLTRAYINSSSRCDLKTSSFIRLLYIFSMKPSSSWL